MGAGESQDRDIQIGCNLEPDIGRQLNAYAKRCEVSRSKLLALLVVRELSRRQLGRLRDTYDGSVDKKGTKRVTCRMMSKERRDRFYRHIKGLDIGREDGLAILARREIEEQWFAKVLELPESELILNVGKGSIGK